MKKYIIAHLSTFFILMGSLTSCGNFEELNTNPDETNVVTSQLIATAVIKKTFLHSGDAKAYLGNSALPKYIAMERDIPAEQYNVVGSCNYSSLLTLPNLKEMERYSEGTQYENSYKGLSAFIKAWNFYRLTMLTGDIPCSQTGLAEQGIVAPQYDTQEDVFKQIIDLLQLSDSKFANAKDFQGDFIFNGNSSKWRKASNALLLKVLLSMSSKITEEQKTLFARVASSAELMNSNDDNLRITYTTEKGTWHPLYNQTLFDPYTMVSSTIVDELKKLKDRRLFYIAEPATGLLSETVKENNYEAYNGVLASLALETMSINYQKGNYSIINNRYIKKQDGDPYLLLSYPEQCFILAEAAILGWIPDNPEMLYKKGVEAAMQLFASYDPKNSYNHGMIIDNNYISEYLKGDAAFKSNENSRLEQIWMQKYILKFLQDGVDSYFDFRRNKYPALPLDPQTNMNIDNKNGFPMRWKYPSGEFQTNLTNINNALVRQFGSEYDGINELMWILK